MRIQVNLTLRGAKRRSFAMSEFSGIVSLFLIVAAFMTSCNPQPTHGDKAPVAPYCAE